MTRVCGDCWHILRPDQYEPNTYIDGTCNMCGAEWAYVHRVARAEIVAELKRWNNGPAARGGRFVIGADNMVRFVAERRNGLRPLGEVGFEAGLFADLDNKETVQND